MPINYLTLIETLEFPVTKDEILNHARDHHVSRKVLAELEALPADNYRNFEDLSRSLLLIESVPRHNGQYFSSLLGARQPMHGFKQPGIAPVMMKAPEK